MSQITTEQLSAAIKYFNNVNNMAVKTGFDKMPLVMQIFSIAAQDLLSLSTDPNVKVIDAEPPEQTVEAAQTMGSDSHGKPDMPAFYRNYSLIFTCAERDKRLAEPTPGI